MSGLDRYDQDDIDDADVGQDVTFEEAQAARLRAEAELDRRDAREGVGGRRQRLPGALEGAHLQRCASNLYAIPKSKSAFYCAWLLTFAIKSPLNVLSVLLRSFERQKKAADSFEMGDLRWENDMGFVKWYHQEPAFA